jgi:5-methylcytosine-specific restriction endonuclease McrA
MPNLLARTDTGVGRPTDAAVQAALARLDARIESAHSHTPDYTSPRWEWPSIARCCYWCKRRNVQLLYRVHSRRKFTYGHDGPTGTERVMSAICVDDEDCAAYRARQYEVRSRRSGVLFVIVEPPFKGKHRGRGWCRWCGERIHLVDGDDYRREAREYHRGDEFECGERNCQSEWWLSRTSEARIAVVRRDLLEHGNVFCRGCGLVCVELKEGALSRYGRDAREIPGCYWEADHRHALEDGGEHALDNLQCLCVPCHRRQTARENRARAERRASLRLDGAPLRH